MSVEAIGGISSAGGGGISSAGGGGNVGATHTAASTSKAQGNESGTKGVSNVNSNNSSGNTFINISQISTQSMISLKSGCQSSGPGSIGAMSGPQQGGLDLKKMVEMLMIMMVMKMMQDMMKMMSSVGA